MKTDNVAKKNRIDWVDYAKGICIIAVVALYATYVVEASMHAQGWMHYFAKFAQPFRMPDFFFLSGLFVSRVIDRPWRVYVDSKILHLLYFYTLWVFLRFLFGHAHWQAGTGSIWFIFTLALFFLAVKLARPIPVAIVFIVAIALRFSDYNTGWRMIDGFGWYFIFFYSGHVFEKYAFRLATWASDHVSLTLTILTIWFVLNATWVWSGVANVPIAHLIAGYAGALAVILLAVMLEGRSWTGWIRYLGAKSIVVYLGFIIAVSTLPRLILKYSLIDDVGSATLFVCVVAIVSSILLYWTVRNTPLRFLFVRPAWASILPTNDTVKKEVGVHSE